MDLANQSDSASAINIKFMPRRSSSEPLDSSAIEPSNEPDLRSEKESMEHKVMERIAAEVVF
jgi:hypothetical protein